MLLCKHSANITINEDKACRLYFALGSTCCCTYHTEGKSAFAKPTKPLLPPPHPLHLNRTSHHYTIQNTPLLQALCKIVLNSIWQLSSLTCWMLYLWKCIDLVEVYLYTFVQENCGLTLLISFSFNKLVRSKTMNIFTHIRGFVYSFIAVHTMPDSEKNQRT